MPPYSTTKPCPNCAKPIRLDATNCWFCGDVFNTVRCAECGSPIKMGSPACQMCGEQAPDTFTTTPVSRPNPAAATPPRATRANEQECPACDGIVPLAAVKCRHCGEPLDGPNRHAGRPRWGEGKTYAPHRGGKLLALAVVSLFCFPVVVGPLTVVLATGDLKAMHAERMDPDGAGLTWSALVIGAVITLLAYGLLASYLFTNWF